MKAGKQISYEEALVRMARGEKLFGKWLSADPHEVRLSGTKLEYRFLHEDKWTPSNCDLSSGFLRETWRFHEVAPEPRRWEGEALVQGNSAGTCRVEFKSIDNLPLPGSEMCRVVIEEIP